MNSLITRGLENKIKKKKTPKNDSLKKEYSEFLKNNKSKRKSKRRSKKSSPLNKKIKITENKKDPVFIKTESKKLSHKKVSPKKNKVPHKKPETKKVEPKKVEPKKPEPKKVEPKKVEPKKVEPKKPETKKHKKNVVSLKSKRRFSKKSRRTKLDKKHTKSRKISFKCYPQKEKNIGDVMKKANKMSEEQMKKELLSNGIEIKGTKNKLLKDIYMFSLLGGIKIQKE